jgi:hypothetical protein
MIPLFKELVAATVRGIAEVTTIRSLLVIIPSTPLADIPNALSIGIKHEILRDTAEEVVITFKLGTRSVRLMQCRDVDVTDERSYNRSARARESQANTNAQLQEAAMTPQETQYIMAQLFTDCLATDDFREFEYLERLKDGNNTSQKKTFEAWSKLRMAAQERF